MAGKNPYAPATGFTNFARYFNANKAESEEEAQRLAKEAQQKISQANQARESVAADFKARSQNNTKAAGSGVATNVGTGAIPAGLSSAQYEDMRGRVGYQGASSFADEKFKDSGYEGALAKSKYADAYTDALQSQAGIQALQNANTQGEGMFSAGLTGAAGADQFRELRQYFDPDKDWKAAGEEAQREAQAGQASADQLKNALTVKRDEAKAGEDAATSATNAAEADKIDRMFVADTERRRQAVPYDKFNDIYEVARHQDSGNVVDSLGEAWKAMLGKGVERRDAVPDDVYAQLSPYEWSRLMQITDTQQFGHKFNQDEYNQFYDQLMKHYRGRKHGDIDSLGNNTSRAWNDSEAHEINR
jgi:hypothetical protein